MNINLTPGLSKKSETIVKKHETASAYGSGSLEVYATPAMIAFMENTALNAVASHLPKGYNTVGTHVNIKHHKATPVGMKVQCKATLTAAVGNKLIFEIEARDEEGKIGSGEHKRYIVDEARFMKKFGNKGL
ncbi:MAG: thioesterase family protein [Bacteroidales bacterium]